ncbi:hypothetical protein BASA50_000892 [Batrachochytrium salamandrivorans]|uniref:EamA domain-containing protein n=1 Tax=Batrachochytrium salamandrivorans TaxID=1357716 RepID=A0ABQ8ESL9_9FUNG|nr:hypothetical protein BASA62_006598 [Batrachochytrium salamandrivorans]KAH6576361.1 hypothetical protein BASA60_004561 [Batrachochytrium salamandrivorans]KAH6585949.1 hypothetical protein BASA50_000892 [Batrachochytrium salamandrivorans]KAH9265606.1 hypothetical protein BASA84_001502 [Batrachochytrium salamandrivorans]KAJ1337009.1 hypothetical protein BSLG_006769 [Batrachochytrium salamandrivorans]
MLAEWFLLHTLALVAAVMGATPPPATAGHCSSDDDCVVYNKRLLGWSPGSRSGGYLCVNDQCAYVVAAGEMCKKPSDCSIYQYVDRAIARNSSSSLLPAAAISNPTAYLNSVCAPEYCTIASSCSTNSDPLFNADPASGVINIPGQYLGQSCCTGATTTDTCAQLGSFLDICNNDNVCSTSSDPNINHLICVHISERSTQWIGVIITLVGAATLNIGLNLQKLALRKRHEKVVKKKEQQRSKVVRKIASMRLGFFDLYRKYSFASLSFARRNGSDSPTPPSWSTPMTDITANAGTRESESLPSRSTDLEQSSKTPKKAALQDSTSPLLLSSTTSPQSEREAGVIAPGDALDASHLTLSQPEGRPETDVDLPTQTMHHNGGDQETHQSIPLNSEQASDTVTSSHNHLIEHTDSNKPHNEPKRQSFARRKSIHDQRSRRISMGNMPEVIDKPEFQKKLNFGSLVRNPAWMLGMLVFIIGNLLNFVALQFAAQSLVAPLGSISLVVNVIIAPLLNNEKWTYKDVIGVVLIVGGSSMVVAFSGVSGKDYNLCVLLALFRRVPTIVFLVVTGVLIAAIFVTIVTIEKNLQLVDEPSAATIRETLAGRLVMVETNIEDSNNQSSDSQEAQLPVIADNINGLVVSIRQSTTSHGETRRTLTLAETPASPISSPVLAEYNDDSRRFQPRENTVGNLLNAKDTDGRSVYSVCLTFVVDDSLKQKASQPSLGASLPNLASGGGVSPLDLSKNNADPHIEPSAADTLLVEHTRSPSVDFLRPITANKHQDPVTHDLLDPEKEQQQQQQQQQHRSWPLPASHDTTADPCNFPDDPSRERRYSIHSNEYPPMPLSNLERESTLASTLKKKPRCCQCLSPIKRAWNKLPFVIFLKKIKLVPRFKEKILLNSSAVRILLPFSYASIGGLMATITVLFAKASIHLLTATLFENNNQFNNFGAWVITGITFVTAVGQIYWINMGLQRYDALLQIPVFYVVWTLFDVIGGGIYFDEFRGFNAKQYALFIFSITVIFVGVIVLAGRLKSLSDEEIVLNGGVVPTVSDTAASGTGEEGDQATLRDKNGTR